MEDKIKLLTASLEQEQIKNETIDKLEATINNLTRQLEQQDAVNKNCLEQTMREQQLKDDKVMELEAVTSKLGK